MVKHENLNGVTLRELKDFIAGMPDTDEDGEPYEVWVETGRYLSSPVLLLVTLNRGDVMLAPGDVWDNSATRNEPRSRPTVQNVEESGPCTR